MIIRPALHVTQGLPAAGKTSLARKLLANAVRPIRYVGLDSLRLMLDGQTPTAWWAPGSEEQTARAQAALVRQLLLDGSDVLVDGTHVHPEQAAALAAAVDGLDIQVHVHRLDTPADECIRRDAERPHPIGADCIRRLADRWAAAEASGWRLHAQLTATRPEETTP